MKKIFICLLTFALILALCACSAAGNVKASDSDFYDSEKSYSGDNAVSERKIAQNITLSMQTKEYDIFLDKVEAKVKEVSGYVSSSSADGNQGGTDNRYARYTVKIPTDKVDAFLAYISDNATVYSKTVATDDVTSKYIDITSRLSALQAEKAKLEELADKAENLDEILTLQKYLTDVIYEIENYQTQLANITELTDYATVYLNINEVERITKSENDSIWKEIRDNLCDGVKNVWAILQWLFVVNISAIPYLIIPALIAVSIVLIVKAKIRKKRK